MEAVKKTYYISWSYSRLLYTVHVERQASKSWHSLNLLPYDLIPQQIHCIKNLPCTRFSASKRLVWHRPLIFSNKTEVIWSCHSSTALLEQDNSSAFRDPYRLSGPSARDPFARLKSHSVLRIDFWGVFRSIFDISNFVLRYQWVFLNRCQTPSFLTNHQILAGRNKTRFKHV